MLKRLLIFFLVIVPAFLSLVFYLISGRVWDLPQENILTTQWKHYQAAPQSDSSLQLAEAALVLLNEGLTDEKEALLVAYFQTIAAQQKMGAVVRYLCAKKFGNRNGLELLILRFDEDFVQQGVSVAFLWKATIATLTGLIPHPNQKAAEIRQKPNKVFLNDLLAAICCDASLSPVQFETILQYNVYAWARHQHKDSSYYRFNQKLDASNNCITESTLIGILPDLLAKGAQVNPKIWPIIDQYLAAPKCKYKGKIVDYSRYRDEIAAYQQKS
jgi:hypothetical protein